MKNICISTTWRALKSSQLNPAFQFQIPPDTTHPLSGCSVCWCVFMNKHFLILLSGPETPEIYFQKIGGI
jgi:hypothetical protein